MTEFRENKDVRRPFLSTPTPIAYFPGSTIEKARRATSRCLRRDEGVALVVGSTGCGKTLLARVLASEFEADSLVAFISPRRRLDVKSFFQQFLFSLRQTFCGCDETELRLMALDYLESASQERCVLLVDDAQYLTLRVFDEIRGLIDQCAASTTRLSSALFGLGALEERLNLPSFFPFQQRVVSRSYLENFTRAEIAKYVESELKRADVDARFSKGAIAQIASLSDGSPRVVNQLCDRALFLAFEDGENNGGENNSARRRRSGRVEIDEKDVERAWARLQSLPESEEKELDSNDLGAEENASSSIVEFGLLDDDESDEYNNESGASTQGTVGEALTNELDSNTEETTKISKSAEIPNDALVQEQEKEESVDERNEESLESGAAPVVVPKPFDWEADRYGSLEEPVKSEAPETNALISTDEVQKDGAEQDVETENAEETSVEKASVEKASAEKASAESGESQTSSQADRSNNIAQEARRIRAKKAFWGEGDLDDVLDGAQVASQAEKEESEAPAPVVETEEEREEQAKQVESAEGVEGVEEIAPEGEIDYELDARLREKFGTSSDLEQTDEATKEESVEAVLPPEIDFDGIRFEPRGGAEFVDPSDFDRSVVKRARKTLRPRSYLSAKLPANSVYTLSEPSEAEDGKTGTFDASLELSPDASATLTTPKAKTRRPLEKDDDGSREFRDFNGFDAEESARLASDDRFLESQFASFPEDSPLRSWNGSSDSKKVDDAEANSLDERAYRQIVASYYRSAADFPSSAQYLNELQLLEEEIAEEANLIRRIRNIHLRLRSVRSSGSYDLAGKDADLSEPTSAFVAK